MLMGALQCADVPGYHALLLRPSLSELQFAGGLIERLQLAESVGIAQQLILSRRCGPQEARQPR